MISTVEARLDEYLKEIRASLKMPHLKYSSILAVTHLIELKQADVKKIPKDWIKMSSTKSVSRYRTPALNNLVNELSLYKERLAVACDKAFSDFISKIAAHYEEYRNVVTAVANLDCLMSLAAVSSQPNYVRAKYVDYPCVRVTQGRHPMVEQILTESYVPNDINMTHKQDRALVITGPNMGGKSSYVRQVALICIMAQIGCYVPAASAEIGLLDAVFTRMGAYDNMLAGESTFMVELKECADIMKSSTERSLVILDEIGRGTGTMDGVAIASAVLSHFITNVRSLTLFVTHYPLLAAYEKMYRKHVSNYHMGFLEKDTDLGKEITFLYTLVRGVAHRSYGLNVARLANIPDEILKTAAKKSAELEKRLDSKREERRVVRHFQFLSAAKNGQVSSEDVEVMWNEFNML
jgi:DNA mismatch repair protein MSH3